MKEKFIIALSLSVLISFIIGCASQTINHRASLNGHEAFEISPVSNETGEAFDSDVAEEMTKQIISKLREEGFNITQTSGKTIIIRISLTSYKTRPEGMVSCTVRSILIDKKTREVLGEIMSTATVSAGELSRLGLEADRAIMEMVADDIVTQIERRIRANR
jgi:hypothetical protein